MKRLSGQGVLWTSLVVFALALALTGADGVRWVGAAEQHPVQCGQYAVYYICVTSGVPLTLKEVAELLPPKKQGESMLEIAAVLERIGFRVQGKKLSWDELLKEPLPLIAHTNDHYVVMERFEDDVVAILDDRGSRRVMAESQLKAQWDGTILTVTKPPADVLMPAYVAKPRGGEPRIRFETLFIDAGEVGLEQKAARYRFPVENRGKGNLSIKGVATNCGCTIADYPKDPLPPNGRGEIVIDYELASELGSFGRTVAVQSNDPRFPVVVLNVAGYAVRKLAVAPQNLHLGRLRPGQTVSEKVYIRYFSREPLKLTKVESDIAGLAAQIEPFSAASLAKVRADSLPLTWRKEIYENSYVLTLTYTPSEKSVGPLRGTVRIGTNLVGREVVEIKVMAEVAKRIEATPPTLFFGTVREGQEVAKEIALQDVAGKQVRILSVDTGQSGLTCDYPRQDAPVAVLRVAGRARKATDLKNAHIMVNVKVADEEDPRTIRIPVYAYLE